MPETPAQSPTVPIDMPGGFRPSPAWVRLLTIVLGLAVLASSLAGIWLAAIALPEPAWATLGFEFVGVVTGVFALLTGLGRFRSGFGLALLFYAGCMLTIAVFGMYLGLRGSLNAGIEQGHTPAIAAKVFKLTLLARMGMAGAFVVLAALTVLSRNRKSWGWIVRGVLLALPLLGVVGWIVKGGGMGVLSAPMTGPADILRIVAMILGGVVFIVLAGISGHCIIQAFELGRPSESK